jgi:hypothetical protein
LWTAVVAVLDRFATVAGWPAFLAGAQAVSRSRRH